MSFVSDDAVSADIKLETEGDDSTDCPTGLSPSAYHPRRALHLALLEWLPEFNRSVAASGPVCQPQIPTPVPILPSVNTCMSLTTTTPATTPVTPGVPQTTPNMNLLTEAVSDSNFNPSMNPVMNSLIAENRVLMGEDAEPMDCNPSPARSVDSMVVEAKDTPEPPTSPCSTPKSTSEPQEEEDDESFLDNAPEIPEDNLTVDDLQLLADLFYLPFEHGRHGINFLTEFNWLKVNSHLVIEHNRTDSNGTPKPEVSPKLFINDLLILFFYSIRFKNGSIRLLNSTI